MTQDNGAYDKQPEGDELEAINARLSELFLAAAEAQNALGSYLVDLGEQFPGIQVTKGPIKAAMVEMAEILMALDDA